MGSSPATPGTYMSDALRVENQRHSEIEEVLKSNWIGPLRALKCSLNEFREWQPHEVSSLFNQLPLLKERKLCPHGPQCRPPPPGAARWKGLAAKTAALAAADLVVVAATPLWILNAKARQGVSDYAKFHRDAIGSSLFVKAPMQILQEAAHLKRAVCVNRRGQFQLIESGYAAISHVWCETMGLEFNDEHVQQDERGLNMAHFNRIMTLAAKSGYEWFWFDLLAIPKVSDDPSQPQSLRKLKADILNSLVDVYTKADAVIVLDALTLQLFSTEPCHIGAILTCGRWCTRMWTYQEIKLARRACIITKTGTVDFASMLSALEVRAQQSPDDNRHWEPIFSKLNKLRLMHLGSVALSDIALGCSDRQTENNIDYARSLFAVLRLEWNADWTYEEAIIHILQARPQEATSIAHMNGHRGLPAPYSWAPKYLARLEGRILGGFTNTGHGLVGFWHTFQMYKVLSWGTNKESTKILMNMQIKGPGDSVISIQVELPKLWTKALEHWVKEDVPAGRSVLLSAKGIDINADAEAPVALLVLQALSAFDFEIGHGSVVSSGAIGYVHGESVANCGERHRWLLA